MNEKKTQIGLTENFEAMLCYVLGWVTGVIFFIIEKESKFVRFHALQSILTFIGVMILFVVLSIIPVLGWLISVVFTPVVIILWIVLMVRAYRGEMWKLPIVGDMAAKQVH
ncbi:MAG TPA: DUF4870 domain-containing protein [Candidatus Goldiibacteriota bacterium]|nr:DUF4870 domain-containing protein [Candidatus Goldiibacteriota bacterium]